MIFNLMVLLMVLAITYFHYAQGLLSSLISMTIALLAAAVAIGCHEALVAGLLGGRMADSAAGLSMVAIFAVIYVVARIITDKIVPGNITTFLYLDKIGAGVCGFVAALAAVGVFATAVQTLPWAAKGGLMHARLEFDDQRNVVQPRADGRGDEDATYLEIKNENPTAADDLGLWIPADSFVTGLVAQQSAEGALGSGVSFSSIHPDFLQQIYRARVGLTPGARHSALTVKGKNHVSIDTENGLFAPASPIRQIDSEIKQVRDRSLEANLTAPPGETLLVIRVSIDAAAADGDDLFRFSPANVRLVAGGNNYHPIGTLEDATLLVANRFDDPLFVRIPAGRANVDLVFRVPDTALVETREPTSLTLKAGIFLEVKRLARLDLGSKVAQIRLPENAGPNGRTVLRKSLIGEEIRKILPAWTDKK